MMTTSPADFVSDLKLDYTRTKAFPGRMTLLADDLGDDRAFGLEELINQFLMVNNYLPIAKTLIELNRSSATLILTKIILEKQPFRVIPDELSTRIDELVEKFLGYFGPQARFFTHGLDYPIDEYPIDHSSALRKTKVRFPFISDELQDYGYGEFSVPTSDPLDLPSGIIACGGGRIGLMYFPSYCG